MPGFLKLSETDFEIQKDVLGTGGMGSVRKGALLNQLLQDRKGFRDIAIKEYQGNHSLLYIIESFKSEKRRSLL